MGRVTDTLIQRIERQVGEHRTVVWFDPEGAYGHLLPDVIRDALDDSDGPAHVVAYDPSRGYFALRRDLESLWAGNEPPRLVIYVPVDQAETHHALIEYTAAGAVLRPGQQPPERNTRLADVARAALAEVFPPNRVAEVVAQVERGQLSLQELDRLAERGIEVQTGAVAIIFGTGNAQEVALRFLHDEALDARITERNAQEMLASLLSDAYGVPFDEAADLPALRQQLARLALTSELLDALAGTVPPALLTLPQPDTDAARLAVVSLAQGWRNRSDLTESYIAWADRVEAELGIANLDLPLAALDELHPFRATEAMLQTRVEVALHEALRPAMATLARARTRGFWSLHDPAVKMRWQVVSDAAEVLSEASRVLAGLGDRSLSAKALLDCYVGAGSEPAWCRLDRAQRHLEQDYHNLEPHTCDELIKLVAHARQQYARAANTLAERFLRAYAAAGLELEWALPQTHVYRKHVERALRGGRVAYVLVDALRFEMAQELVETLSSHGQAELQPALAVPPTITEVGMAALVPGAERGVALVQGKGGRLALVVEDQPLQARQERLKRFESEERATVTARLDEIAPLTDVNLRAAIGKADLVVITASDEIDGLWENSPSVARRMMDDALVQLRRGINVLLSLEVDRVVVTADHGFLLTEGAGAGEGIDPPGGDTVDLHRRCWVGRGGASSGALMRAPLAAFGVGGDLEYATPWNLSHLRVKGGSTVYYHGGLAPQEVVIPVLTVTREAAPSTPMTGDVQWALSSGSQRITTRFVSVQIAGQATQLLPLSTRRLRVEVRAGGRVISAPVSATYGYVEDTGDVEMRPAEQGQQYKPNTVALMIVVDDLPDGEATAHLVDATNGVSLAQTALSLEIRL